MNTVISEVVWVTELCSNFNHKLCLHLRTKRLDNEIFSFWTTDDVLQGLELFREHAFVKLMVLFLIKSLSVFAVRKIERGFWQNLKLRISNHACFIRFTNYKVKECGSHMQLLTSLAIYFNKVWISCWYNLKLMSPLQVGEITSNLFNSKFFCCWFILCKYTSTPLIKLNVKNLQ